MTHRISKCCNVPAPYMHPMTSIDNPYICTGCGRDRDYSDTYEQVPPPSPQPPMVAKTIGNMMAMEWLAKRELSPQPQEATKEEPLKLLARLLTEGRAIPVIDGVRIETKRAHPSPASLQWETGTAGIDESDLIETPRRCDYERCGGCNAPISLGPEGWTHEDPDQRGCERAFLDPLESEGSCPTCHGEGGQGMSCLDCGKASVYSKPAAPLDALSDAMPQEDTVAARSWHKVHGRPDVLGVRTLTNGQREYLMHNEALSQPYYVVIEEMGK